MPRLIPIVLFALITIQATAAAAAPITWTFAGTTNGTGIAEIPVGSPFTVSVFLDSAAPNLCPAGYPTGLYSGSGGVLTIQSAAAGTLVYSSAHSDLLSGSLEPVGCSLAPPSPGPTAFELRMGGWSGPSFADAVFDAQFFGLSPRPGLFWFTVPMNGAFPTEQPVAPYFDGPYYITNSGRRSITSFTFVRPVPEAGTCLLVGIGLMAAAMRLANRRALITRTAPRRTMVCPSEHP